MVLCVFDRSSLWEIFKHDPQRAFDLTWVAAIEEHFPVETITALGQRTDTERVTWAMVRQYLYLSALGLRNKATAPLPYRQHDLADALGLSLVHTNKILSSLRRDGLALSRDDGLDHPRSQKTRRSGIDRFVRGSPQFADLTLFARSVTGPRFLSDASSDRRSSTLSVASRVSGSSAT